jgi:hypothetical protein
MDSNIEDYSSRILEQLSSSVYCAYIAHVDKAMDEYKLSGVLKGELEGFLIVSGDSLLAAKYRELCDKQFAREEAVLIGIEKENIKEMYLKLTNNKVKSRKQNLGIPILFLYKGDHLLKHLDFSITDRMSDQIVDDLYKSIGDLKLVTKMVSSFREYNQMKGRYENN